MKSSVTPLDALKEWFGFDQFRPGQTEIINSVIDGKNVLAILPTGGGKSICYQVPAVMAPSLSIVISPLIALMKDQVDTLKQKGIEAAYLNSTLDFNQVNEVFALILSGKLKLLYVAPEKLESFDFREKIKAIDVSYLFVDEAHCISEWGHNFRPSFRMIRSFAEYTGIDNISAFTATATPDVREDILLQLGMREPEVFVTGFARDNISINVRSDTGKKSELLKIISEYEAPAIIYTSTRKESEKTAELLRQNGYKCTYYHAGLSPEMRKIVQDDFLKGRIDIISATNAFGMGIDKNNIRLVVHYNMPGSMEAYYQEIGRAGRDGKNSHAFLLTNSRDKSLQEYFIKNQYPEYEEVARVYDAICDSVMLAVGNSYNNPVAAGQNLLNKFDLHGISRAKVNSALSVLENAGYIKYNPDFSGNTFLQFSMPPEDLQKYVKKIANTDYKNLIIILLREYGSKLLREKVKINSEKIAESLGIDLKKLFGNFEGLENIGIITLDRPNDEPEIRITAPRADSSYLQIDFQSIKMAESSAFSKLGKMVEFCETENCRSNFILQYFGETHDETCGRCDNCLKKPLFDQNELEWIKTQVIQSLHELKGPVTRRDIFSLLRGTSKKDYLKNISVYGIFRRKEKEKIEHALKQLIEEKSAAEIQGLISLTEKGKENIAGRATPEMKEKNYESELKLFNLLRQARKSVSSRFSQSPDLICPDKILKMIADKKPKNKSEMFFIQGMTNRMFNKAGEEFLLVINEFIKENKTSPEQEVTNKKIPENLLSVHSLLEKKYNISDIASLSGLPEAVVSMQIESLLIYFPGLSINHLFDKNEFEDIKRMADRGIWDMKEIKAGLNKNISFSKIRVALGKIKAG